MILLSLMPPRAAARRLFYTHRMAQFIFTLRRGVVEIFPERHRHMNPPPRYLSSRVTLIGKFGITTISPPPSHDRQMLQRGRWYLHRFPVTCSSLPPPPPPLSPWTTTVHKPNAFLSFSCWCVQGDFFLNVGTMRIYIPSYRNRLRNKYIIK